MQLALTDKSFLIKLSGNGYTIKQQSISLKTFPMDVVTLEYLKQKSVYSIEWILALNSSMSSAETLAKNFTQRTLLIVFTAFFVTLGGTVAAQFFDINWLAIVVMIIGVIFMVVYTVLVIIRFKKEVIQIRDTLTQTINIAKRDHRAKVEEVFLLGCPCCPPLIPAILKIFINSQ